MEQRDIHTIEEDKMPNRNKGKSLSGVKVETENNDLLSGMRCPRCGHQEPFYIRAEATFAIYDTDGEEEWQDENEELDWDEHSLCTCPECSFASSVGAFLELSEEETDVCEKLVRTLCAEDTEFFKEVVAEYVQGMDRLDYHALLND